jgi:hypothetical protein
MSEVDKKVEKLIPLPAGLVAVERQVVLDLRQCLKEIKDANIVEEVGRFQRTIKPLEDVPKQLTSINATLELHGERIGDSKRFRGMVFTAVLFLCGLAVTAGGGALWTAASSSAVTVANQRRIQEHQQQLLALRPELVQEKTIRKALGERVDRLGMDCSNQDKRITGVAESINEHRWSSRHPWKRGSR